MSGKIPDDRGFYFLPTVPDFADISDNRHKSVPETPCSILYLPPPPNWWRVFEYGGSDFFFLKEADKIWTPTLSRTNFSKVLTKNEPFRFHFFKRHRQHFKDQANFQGFGCLSSLEGGGGELQIKNGMSLPPWYLIVRHTGFVWLSKENILIFVTLETSLG